MSRHLSYVTSIYIRNGWIIAIAFIIQFSLSSCISSPEESISGNDDVVQKTFPVYVISRGIHTGLIIPVNSIAKEIITAAVYFENSEYIDFGWGDEDYYQKHGSDKFCLGIKAVLLPTSSVMRAEGRNGMPENLIQWSDYSVQFNLTENSFIKLCRYINKSFRRDSGNNLIETSRKHKGGIIFFKSVYYYHAFNTCNTWAARGLQHAGLDVSSFFVITADDLYDEVKMKGVVLKEK